ncbi:2TM domain-containing protein [Tenacibaculum sp. MAR_2009_124]|uniref:2TM domain-containing protein n=1 Tax=Tenacibaculum sp. MAR_2009_124 TaxID=1250059 RepID=UPI000899830D|nr:2TM domain-containing protein [Tenacibaculum sp. MAR_2009_124]SEB53125.1 2TM domain-containing protein [Tenacibaculum sp. MAR_2009_124]
MEIDNKKQQEKYLRAKNRVDEIKKYYIHLTAYILVNIFISVRRILRDMEFGMSLEQALTEFDSYSLWIFWGIGIGFHTFKVFGFNLLLGKNWEERKIKEYMDE